MQVFDVITFDMIAMLRLSFVPSCAAFIYKVSSYSSAFTLFAPALHFAYKKYCATTDNPEIVLPVLC